MKHLRIVLGMLAGLMASLFIASPAAAYWEYGHETVAAIAWANITPHARAEIRQILKAQAQLDTPTCPVRTIEEASVWPDCVKPLKDENGKSRFGYAYSWHYQNIDICQPFRLPRPATRAIASRRRFRASCRPEGQRASPKERVMALAFLVHFVGDLHQPLHAGDKSDKGGNDTHVDYGVYTTPRLNLHSIWTGCSPSARSPRRPSWSAPIRRPSGGGSRRATSMPGARRTGPSPSAPMPPRWAAIRASRRRRTW